MSSKSQSCALEGTTFPKPLSGLCTRSRLKRPTSELTLITFESLLITFFKGGKGNYLLFLPGNFFIMDFSLTEEQMTIRQAARDFAKQECLPGVIERDEKQQLPREQLMKLGDLGFMGMMVSPEYGGAGMDTVSYVLAMEEISKIDASVSVAMSVNNSLVCWGLQAFGTEEQKKNYLTHLAAGKKDGALYIGAFLLSEPEAGSDATSQRTTAVDHGEYYILNGTKNWITNGNSASVYLVMAQTNVSKGSKGINAFIVEKNSPGISVGVKENKLGIRGSDTHSIGFNEVIVPKENRIGEDGFGFQFAMKTLSGGRIGIAAQALGLASGAFELSLKYSKERKSFGRRSEITRSYNLNWPIWLHVLKRRAYF